MLFPNVRTVTSGIIVITRPGLVRRLVAFLVDMVVAGMISLVMIMAVQLASRANYAELQVVDWVATLLATVVVQVVLPLIWGGFTLGGRLTGACLDDRPRGPLHRLVYYLARLDCLLLMSYALPAMVVIIASIITWRRYRQLAYCVVDLG